MAHTPAPGEPVEYAFAATHELLADGLEIDQEAIVDTAQQYHDRIRLLRVPLPVRCVLRRQIRRTLIGLQHMLGKLVRGYRVDLVGFDLNDMTGLATWVLGAAINPTLGWQRSSKMATARRPGSGRRLGCQGAHGPLFNIDMSGR
jgi:hypothetical protein